MGGGGESIKTLIGGQKMFTLKRNRGTMVGDFQKHCPNITSLSIGKSPGTWINRFGDTLETLEISTGYNGLKYIKDHCTGLLQLIVHSKSYSERWIWPPSLCEKK